MDKALDSVKTETVTAGRYGEGQGVVHRIRSAVHHGKRPGQGRRQVVRKQAIAQWAMARKEQEMAKLPRRPARPATAK
jgi:hypothetical protein